MQADLAKSLQNLGLSENEAKVYLAGLALGPATAQHIAAKAIVTRPTTYIVIESLTKLGLMSSMQRGKKKLFAASKPSQLARILEQKKRELEQNDAALKKIIGLLEDAGSGSRLPPVVVYEDREAVEAVRDDIAASTGDILVLAPGDATLDPDSPVFAASGRGKARKVKSLFAVARGEQKSSAKAGSADRRTLPLEKFPVKSEIVIAGSKAYVSNPEGRRFSMHLQDKFVVESLRAMFNALWDNAKNA